MVPQHLDGFTLPRLTPDRRTRSLSPAPTPDTRPANLAQPAITNRTSTCLSPSQSRYERHPRNYLAFLGLAAALCCYKRLVRLTT